MKKIFVTITLCFLLVLSIITHPAESAQIQQGKWTNKADIPEARKHIDSVEVNGKIYVIGGCDSAFNVSSITFEYDPLKDEWKEKADMPTAREGVCLSLLDGKIYVIGGEASGMGSIFKTVEMYDPDTDTWTKKADMIFPMYAFAAGVANGKIYVFGGGWHASMGVSIVQEYDPITDKWERKNDMPEARGWMAEKAPTVNGKIYVIGGWNPIANPTLTLPTVEEYDPVTDTWIKKADMPTPRANIAAAEIDGKIYAIGGGSFDAGGNFINLFSTVEEYDTKTDTWTKKADMPTARIALAASSLK